MPIDALSDGIRRVAHDLDALGRRYALVGGFAVSARADPRFTRDVDFAIDVVDDRDAEALISDLGYAVMALVEQEATRRLATVLTRLGQGGLRVDLLFASSGIEPEIVRDAEEVELPDDLRVPVARIPHLLAMKALSESDRRPQDRADLLALARRATSADIDEARRLSALIEARGYARQKRPSEVLDRYLELGKRAP